MNQSGVGGARDQRIHIQIFVKISAFVVVVHADNLNPVKIGNIIVYRVIITGRAPNCSQRSGILHRSNVGRSTCKITKIHPKIFHFLGSYTSPRQG